MVRVGFAHPAVGKSELPAICKLGRPCDPSPTVGDAPARVACHSRRAHMVEPHALPKPWDFVATGVIETEVADGSSIGGA